MNKIEIELTHDELVTILSNMHMTVATAQSDTASVNYIEVQNKLKSAERQTRQ